MKLFAFILFFLLPSLLLKAQDFNIEWGELVPRKGVLIEVLPKQANEFYTLRWTGGRLFGHYAVSAYEGLKAGNQGNIKMYAENSMANFEGVETIGGNFVVFLSDKKDGKNHFYMQAYGPELTPKGDAKPLASYDLSGGGSKGWFQFRQSPDNNFMGVIWEIPGKGAIRDKYGFVVYDSSMQVVNEGEYPLPFASKDVEIFSHHIASNGDYFMAIAEYDPEDKGGIFRNKSNYKALHIYHIGPDGLQDFAMDIHGRRVNALAMSSDENKVFTITGTYSSQDGKGETGVFYQRIDFENGKVLSEGFRPFEKDFIMEGWSDRDVRRAEKREDVGKGQPQMSNFVMREAVLMNDGSMVGTMEQYYIQTRTYSDARTGQMSTTYYYYYNDIVVFKINPEGEFDWLEKIRKYQVSTNDGGPFSSYEVFLKDSKMYFIFNDNVENYDEKGSFTNPERIHVTSYTKRKNVVALVEVDLASGGQKRSTFFDRNEVNTLAVPKLFKVNKKDKEVLIYTILGKKEKFGKLNYD